MIWGSTGAERITCGGHIEDRVPPAAPGELHDHLSCLHNLTRPGAGRRHDAGGIRLEFGEAHQILGGLQPRVRGIDLRAGRLQLLLRIVERGPRDHVARQQKLLALEVIARSRQFTLGRRETGLGRAQRVHLVLRFEPRQHLSRLDPVAELEIAFEHPASDAKAERRLVDRLDASGERSHVTRPALLDRDGANRTGLRGGTLDFRLARGENDRQHQRHRGSA